MNTEWRITARLNGFEPERIDDQRGRISPARRIEVGPPSGRQAPEVAPDMTLRVEDIRATADARVRSTA
ncbi:hypothetical protein [Natronomonas sp.]|uniref:hypothetical protein n=1 Tax=Natronomonas sp. TaxID=2184060 RepID=UPI003975B9BA